MPIGVTEQIAEILSTSNASNYTTGSFTPTANCMLLVIGSCSGSSSTVVTVSGGSLTWNVILNDSSTDKRVIAWAQVGGSPASMTINLNATSSSGCCATFWKVTGHDTTGLSPIKQMTRGEGTASNVSMVFDEALDTANGYVGMFVYTSAISVTVPTGWTQDANGNVANPTRQLASAHRATGETTASIAWTNDSAAYWYGGVEVFAAGAAPPKRYSMLMGV